MTSEPESEKHEPTKSPRRDTLTIGRFLLLTAGVAVGLGVFAPVEQPGQMFIADINHTLALYNAVLIGLALPAPVIVLGQRLRKGPTIGPGGLFVLTMGVGALLMLPPVLVGRLNSDPGMPIMCLYYMMPLVSSWYLIAALIAGRVGRKLFARTTAWTERYGFFLAVFWTPVGVWWLITFYMGAF